MAGSLVISEAHPRAPCSIGAMVGEGPHLPTTSFFSQLLPHQARSEVLGAPGWSWGHNPDHRARELTGISGRMLFCKATRAPGARQETSLVPCGFPAPTKTAPRSWGLPSQRSPP